jgi:hypothetical protein
MKEEYTQEELKEMSDGFLTMVKKSNGDYPTDYEKYLVGWQNLDGSFSYGTYDEANMQVEHQSNGKGLWNFPIKKL